MISDSRWLVGIEILQHYSGPDNVHKLAESIVLEAHLHNIENQATTAKKSRNGSKFNLGLLRRSK